MAVQKSSDFLSAKQLAVYDRILLMRAVANQVFDRFGVTKSIPTRSNTKTAFAYRYKNILPATTPLAEYNGSNIKASNKIKREEVTFSVGHYGDYITYTDELDLYDLDTVRDSFLNILGDQASLTVDTIRRDALRGGTNVIYADGAVSRLTVADGAKKITVNDTDIASTKLKNQGAKKFTKVVVGSTAVGTAPIKASYIAICSPEVVNDLRKLTGWKEVHTYSDYSKAMEDEQGSIGDFRVIESMNNDPIKNQGTGLNKNVHLSLFLGMEAYATVTLRSKEGIQTIVKPIGSSGANDPLDQFGSVGWKAITGCAILNEAWLIRVESTASLEDSTVKHYYDFS